MWCPRCQHENPQQAKFCLECGAPLALTCTKCRADLPGSAKFCLECGEPVALQIQTRSPESYTPKRLAEKILTSKAAREGRAEAGDASRLPDLAAELVRLNVRVIVTAGGAVAPAAARPTTTIPIVQASAADLVAVGVVAAWLGPAEMSRA